MSPDGGPTGVAAGAAPHHIWQRDEGRRCYRAPALNRFRLTGDPAVPSFAGTGWVVPRLSGANTTNPLLTKSSTNRSGVLKVGD